MKAWLKPVYYSLIHQFAHMYSLIIRRLRQGIFNLVIVPRSMGLHFLIFFTKDNQLLAIMYLDSLIGINF
jgi:hypothetical protein